MEFEKNFDNLNFKHMDALRNSVKQSVEQSLKMISPLGINVSEYMHS